MTTSSVVYEAIIKECESMELKKSYSGNGHHLAQRLAEMVKKKFEEMNLIVITKNQYEAYQEFANNPIFED